MNRVDDEAHHRLRGVIYTPCLAEAGVVFSQKGLLEVDDRVAAAGEVVQVANHP